MRDYALAVLSIFVGFSMLTLSMAYYENSKSAQEIENLENLYRIKGNLNTRKSIEDTDKWIKITEKRIDSLNRY